MADPSPSHAAPPGREQPAAERARALTLRLYNEERELGLLPGLHLSGVRREKAVGAEVGNNHVTTDHLKVAVFSANPAAVDGDVPLGGRCSDSRGRGPFGAAPEADPLPDRHAGAVGPTATAGIAAGGSSAFAEDDDEGWGQGTDERRRCARLRFFHSAARNRVRQLRSRHNLAKACPLVLRRHGGIR